MGNSRRYDDDRNYEPHRGVLILVLGIIGLVAFGPAGIVAWIMGNGDLKAMDEGRMDPEGRGLTQTGKILGMIATLLMGLALIMVIFMVLAMILFAGAATSAH